MGKKIIFFSTPAFGHINSVYPVIKELVNNGYIVDWHCSNKYKDLVLRTGANYIEYKIDFERFNLMELTENFYNLYKGLLQINRSGYTLYFDELKTQKPDLILYDSMCSFGKNISKKLKIKSICLCTTMAYNVFTFIFSNMFLSTAKLLIKNFSSIKELYIEENRFRKNNGIQKLNAMDLFVNKGDKTIVFTPKEFQPFYKTFSKSFIFVGTTIKSRLELRAKSYNNYDVYVSLGTISTENRELLNEIIHSKFLKDKKSIITVGNIKFDEINNIEYSEFVDQLSLLPKIDLFINHGGLNSVYECIYFGKKQVCMPQQEEQKMTAIITKRKKVGGYLKKYNDKKLCNLKKTNRTFKNIKKYQKIFQGYDGTKNATKIIIDYMLKV